MFRFTCSVVLRGGRGISSNITGVCGEYSHYFSPTGFAPAHRCVLSPSTLLRLQVAQTRLSLRFVPSWVRAAQATRSLTRTLSSAAARLLPSPSQPQFPGAPVRCALCLFWGADLWLRPSWQMSTIQNLRKPLVRNWKPVCSLVGDAVSGAEFASFPSPLPPDSGGGWASPQLTSSCLVLLSPLFCKPPAVP